MTLMTSIPVKSSQGNYSIMIGNHLLSQAGALIEKVPAPALSSKSSAFSRKVMVVSQAKIAKHYLSVLRNSLIAKGFCVSVHLVPDGEAAKTEKELFRLYAVLLKEGFERRDILIGLGGGVVGDLTGFAASSYLRGVCFINIGTTLLAQVDSSIGGKTGINLLEGKNLVGAFYPPKLVISDMSVLRTLPEREYKASLAEVIKYGIIRDLKLFRFLEQNVSKILARNPDALSRIVTACSRIKASVVSRDEKETKGERMILNYGHTFGHAFEQVLNYKNIMHGEAVSVGMICAARLASRLGLFSVADERRQSQLILKLGLPVSLSKFKIKLQAVLPAMNRDKKKSSGKLKFVLPDRIGHVVIRKDIPAHLIRESIELVIS